jgi:hypothetical protein
LHGLGGVGDAQLLPSRYCLAVSEELRCRVGGGGDLGGGAPAHGGTLLEEPEAVPVAVGQVAQPVRLERGGDRDHPPGFGHAPLCLPTATRMPALPICSPVMPGTVPAGAPSGVEVGEPADEPLLNSWSMMPDLAVSDPRHSQPSLAGSPAARRRSRRISPTPWSTRSTGSWNNFMHSRP